jgi:hypothetical protein
VRQTRGPLESSSRGIIAACLLLGCGTTPIEAVVADSAPSGDDDGEVMGGAECNAPGAGRFLLSLETGCVRRGEATTVFGTDAVTTELAGDCVSARAQWDLTPAASGTFTVRNVDNQLFLDVRAASDAPGTPVVGYPPTSFDNQRFWFRPRAAARYELAPRHAPTFCMQARGSEIEIWPCQSDESTQAFLVARVACP